MERKSFYLKLLLASTGFLLASFSLTTGQSLKGLTAAVLTLGALMLVRSAEKVSRKSGRTEKMKTALEVIRPTRELLLVSAAMISYSVGIEVGVAVLGFVAFSEIFQRSFRDTEEYFGQEVRLVLLVLALLGSEYNSYILFYGVLAIGLVAVYDSAYMIYNRLKKPY